MDIVMCLVSFVLVLGVIGVVSNPAPYFAALGLAVTAGIGCGLLVTNGGSLIGLMLFMIYLGGMLVVFAYTVSLSSDLFPETWGSWPVKIYVLVYLLMAGAGFWWFVWGCGNPWKVVDEFKEFFVVRGDIGGISLLYSVGGIMLMMCVWVLFLCLIVVLELTRGLGRGTLRAI